MKQSQREKKLSERKSDKMPGVSVENNIDEELLGGAHRLLARVGAGGGRHFTQSRRPLAQRSEQDLD